MDTKSTKTMNPTIVEFPDRAQIEEAAAQWIVRLDNDRLLEPQELQQLRDWLAASPAHREELTALTEFWSDQSLTALPIPLERLCYEAANSKAEQPARSRIGIPWLGAVAATLIGAVLIVSTANWGSSNINAAYATAIGQQRTLDLPDGSTLYLNTNSQVNVNFTDNYRTIKLLQGEAHFEVAKDKTRPFRVYAGRGRVQAVGTAFTVLYKNNQDVDVVVNEGTVALAVLVEKGGTVSPAAPKAPAPKATVPDTPAQTATAAKTTSTTTPQSDTTAEYYLAIPVDELGLLEAGQATTILVAHESQVAAPNQLDSIKQVAEDELQRRGAWRSGLLVFSGDSLEEVVKEISRYTTLSINIVDPELKTVRIGGRFSINSTAALFDALEANFGLKITRLDYNRVEISAAEKNNANKAE